MPGIPRLTAAERTAIRRITISLSAYNGLVQHCQEPALGTLDERLGIIVRRLGGRTGPLPRLSAAEREQYRA